MIKKISLILSIGLVVLFSGCADTSPNYNYDNRSYNDRQIDKVITTEMNSLSDADIAQLNKLK